MNDKATSDTVKKVLMDTFLKPKEKMDVNILAAERLAINLLNEAFQEMEHLREVDKEKINKSNIGL